MLTGSGKTQAAINRMNEDEENHYIFITPYLSETKRIARACSERNFYCPEHKGIGKLKDLENKLREKRNISSTHALLQYYTKDTIKLIEEGNYKLILDEAFDVVDQIKVHKHDMNYLFGCGAIRYCEGSNERIEWVDKEYQGNVFKELKDKIEDGNVVYYENELLLWHFPIEVFKAFKEVIILTYLFEAQVQKYYYEMNNVKIKYIGVKQNALGEYYFSEDVKQPDYAKDLINKIHILDDERLNEIGDKHNALSSSWYDREMEQRGKPKIKELKNNIYNVFRHKFNASSQTSMWTTFKKGKDILKPKGYANSFIEWNCRATNDYSDRKYIAYCVNVYFMPILKNYFLTHGANVQEDVYALSEMIQFVFRSAIRNNEDIWIYVPSSRMRNLFINWLKSLNEEV